MKLNFSFFDPPYFLALLFTAGIRWWRTFWYQRHPPSGASARAWVFLKSDQLSSSYIPKFSKYSNICKLFVFYRLTAWKLSFRKNNIECQFCFHPKLFHTGITKLGDAQELKLTFQKVKKLSSCSLLLSLLSSLDQKSYFRKIAFFRMQSTKFSRAQGCWSSARAAICVTYLLQKPFVACVSSHSFLGNVGLHFNNKMGQFWGIHGSLLAAQNFYSESYFQRKSSKSFRWTLAKWIFLSTTKAMYKWVSI